MQERIQSVYLSTSLVLNSLYKKRKRTLFYQRIMWAITGIYILFMLVLLAIQYTDSRYLGANEFVRFFSPSYQNPYASLYPIIGLMLLLYPSTVFFVKAFQKFKTEELQTMAKMVRALFPNVQFTQGARAPIREVVKSKLFAWIKEESPIYSYGQIKSSTNQTAIHIADIGIAEPNAARRVSGLLMQIPILNMFGVLYQSVYKNIATNKLADTTQYSFRGMFCWLSFAKKLQGHTVVLPKSHVTKLDRWVSFNFSEEQAIELEDPRFTEKFIVYATDQVEARYILSAVLMERVVTLKEKFDRPLFLSFQNQQMYLAVENENGLFSFSKGLLDSKRVVEELAAEIDMALKIPEDIQ